MKMMKKILLLITFAAIIISCSQQSGNDKKQGKAFPKYSLVMMNPTVSNIKTFRYLVDNEIIPNIDSFGITGLYHAKQDYDFQLSQKYIDENNLAIKLVKCESGLSPQNIYKQNDCSNLFKEIFEQTEGVFSLVVPIFRADVLAKKHI
jgi:hypothetical protein